MPGTKPINIITTTITATINDGCEIYQVDATSGNILFTLPNILNISFVE